MSYILDALRKSETERNLGDYAPAQDPAFAITDPSHSRLRLALIVGGAIAVFGLAFLWLSNRAPVTPEPKVVSAKPEANESKSVLPAGQARDLASETEVRRETPKRSVAPAKSAPAPVKSATLVDDDIKFLRTMPASFRNRLPALAINIHVYSPELSQQILFINNREVKPGQRVEGGAVLESITPDGAVLQLDGTRFKLPRPS